MKRSLPFSACSRRQFLSGCVACAGCAVGGTLVKPLEARAATDGRPKVRLVFCEADRNKAIWPNIGYDFDTRRNRILELLAQGCPDVEFLPVTLMDDPKQTEAVLKDDAQVGGYLVCTQGLGWRNDIVKLCATGKPTLLVDNLFGGSGLFLCRQPQIRKSGQPVDWVSSANDQDIVASARHFALLKQGKPAAEIAAAFRATRRQKTPGAGETPCKPDRIATPDFAEALKQLRQTKILVVGGGWGGDAFRKASEEAIGVKFVPIKFEEMAAAYDAAPPDASKAFADRWMGEAQAVVEPDRQQIEKSGAMYVGMQQLLKKHGVQGISVNCLGGFYGGHLKAYPCLGFSQFNNDGFVGGCEADQMSALTMMTMGALVHRPGYISDPVIDTSRGAIIYAHCVATTRPFGSQGPASPYRLRNHSEDRHGAAVQSLLPDGYMVTTMEINPQSKQVILHRARTIGNNPSDMACRTKLEAVVQGDIEKLTENWRLGWHRVTFYGDLKDCVSELCGRLKLDLIEEA